MDKKEYIQYLEYCKDRISFRLNNKITASSFKQALKAIDKINSELERFRPKK